MILQKEISTISEKTGVPKSTIEKDWILGHFLDAIFSIKELRNKLIFKGGTCLKKCYFPDYRFSEDLDFTSIDKHFELTDKLLNKIISIVNKKSGAYCHIASLKDLTFENKKTGYEAIIKYWGADHSKNQPIPNPDRWLTSIKIEIILYELLLFAPDKKKLFHSYSDNLSESSNNISCYTIEEILAEKVRALLQRKYTAPRDYYDIWYLSNNINNVDNEKVASAFYEKARYKNIKFSSIEQIINLQNEKILISNWKNSLFYQIKSNELPECSIVISTVKEYLSKILKKHY